MLTSPHERKSMTDFAGYRPKDDSALRWEDFHCTTCGHHDRYHFADGQGSIVCRAGNGCKCTRPAVPQPADPK
jgi:hypothetical protein